MKSFSIITAVVMIASATGCKSQSHSKKGVGIELNNIDSTISPQADFFHFANGSWLKNNPIPADQSRWGSFNILGEQNKKNLKEVAESAAANKSAAKGSPEQLVGDFYSSAMGTATIEKVGSTPIKPEMDAIAAIKDMNGIYAEVAKIQIWGGNPMFGFYSGQDPKNSEVVVPQIYQGGISLPDRDFYLKDDARSKTIREEFVKHVAKMFELYGDKANASKNAATVMQIETDLAKASMTRVELRDPYKTYHKVMISELDAMTPSLKWADMMNKMEVHGKYDYLVLGQPDFLKELQRQLRTTSLNDWKIYLQWHLLNLAGNILSKDFVMEDFHFNSQVMNGQKQIQDRWKRMIGLTDNLVGEALGQLYVKKYFPPEAKKKADELVGNLMAIHDN